jgi:hypothetical protein
MTEFLSTGVLTATTMPQLLCPGRSLQRSVWMRSLNTNVQPVYIIQPGKSHTEGYPLYPGDSIELTLSESWLFEVVTAAATAEVRYIAS